MKKKSKVIYVSNIKNYKRKNGSIVKTDLGYYCLLKDVKIKTK